MFPGSINPRQMKQMMKRMGIKTEEINAENVIIKGIDKDIIIENPQVIKTIMQGQEVFQISGEVREEERDEEAVEISEEDTEMVAQQANVSREEAKKALEESNGDIAQAIVNLKS